MGVFSKLAKISPIFLPKSFSRISLTCSNGKEGTLSCSFSSSFAYSFGTKSGLTLNSWLNLMNVGPSLSKAFQLPFDYLAEWYVGLEPRFINQKIEPLFKQNYKYLIESPYFSHLFY